MILAILMSLPLLVTGCDQGAVVPRRDLEILTRAKETGESQRPRAGACTPTDIRTFYRDADGDGFGDKTKPIKGCEAPLGFVDNADDCYDGNRHARPGQRGYFAEHRGDGSFDYDCDGKATRRFTSRGFCREREGGAGCTFDSGWTGKTIPACGEPAEFAWMTCSEQVLIQAPSDSPDAGLLTHSAGALAPGVKQTKIYRCGGRPLPWLKRQLCR